MRTLVVSPYADILTCARVNVRRPVELVASGWEYELISARPAFPAFNLRIAWVAAVFFAAALVAGRQHESRHRMPSETGLKVGPPGLAFDNGSLRYLASVGNPTPHPFRKSINRPPTTIPHTNVAGNPNYTPAFHTNTAGNPVDVTTPHANTFTPHTNIDARPFSGPL